MQVIYNGVTTTNTPSEVGSSCFDSHHTTFLNRVDCEATCRTPSVNPNVGVSGGCRVAGKPVPFDALRRKCIPAFALSTLLRGGLAQLGERLNGIQEVEGSIPLSSTYLKP